MGDDNIPGVPTGDTTEHFSLASIMLEIPRCATLLAMVCQGCRSRPMQMCFVSVCHIRNKCDKFRSPNACAGRTDLAALQDKFGEVGGMKLSKNDILIGIYWSMRCIAAGTPLPGQARSLGIQQLKHPAYLTLQLIRCV